jgi:glycosyltransferase involved in cell wall biosynthesis
MGGTVDRARWICCHLGAREHYAVPRALHRRGELAGLITDAWAGPGSPWSLIPGVSGRRLRERYSADLASTPVRAFTSSLLAHEGAWRLQGLTGWPLVLARNAWFQGRAARALDGAVAGDEAPTVVFAHSYAALEVFRQAKASGWTTLLGQIDPGEAHLQTLRAVSDRWPEFGPRLSEPPADYFTAWREECRLADRIVVNSEWSRDSLARAGIDSSKVHVVPLPYQAESGEPAFERRYPEAFSEARPLRVLFIGSVAVFKGVPSLLESLDRLGGAPVELRMVGPIAAAIPDRFLADRRIRWVGAVSRSEVMDYCRSSDVLVFPSHSDGFGMAQVEAQAWRLPIIASRSCGRVVQDGVNGLLLPEVSAEAIAAALTQVMDPAVLGRLSARVPGGGSTLDEFGAALSGVVARD